jgi:hypothetical protein
VWALSTLHSHSHYWLCYLGNTRVTSTHSGADQSFPISFSRASFSSHFFFISAANWDRTHTPHRHWLQACKSDTSDAPWTTRPVPPYQLWFNVRECKGKSSWQLTFVCFYWHQTASTLIQRAWKQYMTANLHERFWLRITCMFATSYAVRLSMGEHWPWRWVP